MKLNSLALCTAVSVAGLLFGRGVFGQAVVYEAEIIARSGDVFGNRRRIGASSSCASPQYFSAFERAGDWRQRSRPIWRYVADVQFVRTIVSEVFFDTEKFRQWSRESMRQDREER